MNHLDVIHELESALRTLQSAGFTHKAMRVAIDALYEKIERMKGEAS